MKEFKISALGGTFDLLHKGHLALLRKGFSISSKVIIGLTSDDFAKKKGKELVNDYSKRYKNLEEYIQRNFPGSNYEISKLENDFGPAVLQKEVEVLVVSEETSHQGDVLNQIRLQNNSPPVKVIVVPMVLAKDGKRISTSRIKNSEIDLEGNILGIDK